MSQHTVFSWRLEGGKLSPESDPTALMHRCTELLLAGEAPSPDTLRSLWKLSRHPDARIREAALILFSSPPVEDDSLHLKATLEACLRFGRTRAREIPPPVFDLFFDLWEQAHAFGIQLRNGSDFRSLLSRLPLEPLAALLERPCSMEPFLPLMAHRLARLIEGARPSRAKRRWRSLRLKMKRQSGSPQWSRTAFTDLRLHGRRRPGGRRAGRISGPWMCLRPLLFEAAGTALHRPPTSFRRVQWAGLGNLSAAWLDRLLDHQGRELTSIRGLAHDVSRNTRRAVLSWHNAGLAAAGGWAFEDLAEAIPSAKLREELVRRARVREVEIRGLDRGAEAGAQRLLRLRAERLAFPAARRALREACSLNGLDPAWERACAEARATAVEWMPEAEFEEGLLDGKHCWSGPGSPGQRRPLRDILAWWKLERESWIGGLARLAALAVEAERLLRQGDLESFVLPWVDKFFISSTRLTDSTYLPALAQWIEDRGITPLILFWEDTIHAARPSFRLALDVMRARGLPFRGIGIFDEEGSRRLHAFERIIESHSRVRLFALRPWEDTHHPGSFHAMVKARDFGFYRPYDSSWKDNLGFLYVGTQVFPLLSDAGYGERLPAWVGVGGRKHPFGQFFRQGVRWRSLGQMGRDSKDRLSARYARWANLR